MANNFPSSSRSRPRSIFSSDATESALKPKAPITSPPSNTAYGIGTVFFVLLAGAIVIATMEMKDVFGPFLALLGFDASSTPPVIEISSQQKGDTLFAQMKADDEHAAQLCSEVMEEIYALAEKNPSAHQLKLTLQVAGKSETTVQIEDLDAVRKYRNKTTYENSGHREFVGAPLVAANLIQESSLVVSASADGDQDLIGNYYVSGPQWKKQLGLKFINENEVEFYADGAHYATCNYTESGDSITIVTSCSVMHIQKQGEDLVDGQFGHLSRQ